MSNELDQILTSEGQPDFAYKLGQLRGSILHGATFDPNEDEFKVVSKIIWEVLEHRDQALRKCTQEYDHVDIKPEEFQIPKEDLEKAHSEIDQELLKSLRQAIENVRKYQKEILHSGKNHPGITYKLIEPVGICVPGASAPLPSTVIMTAVPAQVAGVKNIAVVSPPRYKGSIHPVILAV